MLPVIKKAKSVVGKSLVLRDIEEEDAEFVVNLRGDPVKGRYLSAISGKLEDQVNWIRGYKGKNDQAYFIVCDRDRNRLGCIRMYDAIEDSYWWGSWLMITGLAPLVAIETALLVYAYGKSLGFDQARIKVRRDNKFVWGFHEKFSSAELVSETELDRVYVVRSESIDKMLAKYSNLLTTPLKVWKY
ncbi:MAG: GNAT family N-acetyltransferase [Terriglobales bacterium]